MEVWNKQVREAGQQTALRAPVELARIAAFPLAGLEVDPSRKMVRAADGREETLEPRVMQVLCALARADGAILTRDDLVSSCWSGLNVGEDAIQRVVARLRKLATGIGEDRFTIETLPKIGYRLIVPQADAPAIAKGTTAPPLPTRKPRRFVIAACAVLALLAASGLWWWVQPAGPRTIALAIDPLQQAKAMSSAAGDPFDAQLRAALNNAAGIIVRPDKPDYRLESTVTQETPDTLRYSFNLQAADGTMPWSASFPGAATARQQTRMAQKINQILRCGLGGLAITPRALPADATSLFFELCQPGAYLRQIDLGRRLTAAAPDFAPGWSQLAIAYESASFMSTPGEAVGFLAQATATARHAIALNPNMGAPYQILSYLLPPNASLIEREHLLQKAVAGYSDSGREHAFYQYFLTAVGRIGAAMGEAQRADDMGAANAASMARVIYFYGQPAEAIAMLTPMANDHYLIADWARLDAAIYARNWAKAAAIKQGQAGDPAGPILAEAYAALASGDKARIAHAADAVQRVARAQGDGHYQQHQAGMSDQPGLLLAVMGRPDGAFDAIAAMIRTNGPEGLEMLFDPVMAPYRETPRYVAMLKSSGLVDYWRATHTQPDLCNARGAPGWCRTLG